MEDSKASQDILKLVWVHRLVLTWWHCLVVPTGAFSADDKVFAEAGVLEVLVAIMARLVHEPRLQAYGCEAISSVCAALPDDRNCFKPMADAFRAGVHHAAARALNRHVFVGSTTVKAEHTRSKV